MRDEGKLVGENLWGTTKEIAMMTTIAKKVKSKPG
jgi:hypothetical protein